MRAWSWRVRCRAVACARMRVELASRAAPLATKRRDDVILRVCITCVCSKKSNAAVGGVPCDVYSFAELDTGLDLPPTNQTPVLFDATGQGDFFTLLGAHGRGELKLGEITLDGDDSRTGTHRSDV